MSPAPQAASLALLKELTCISVDDVKDWMEKHRYGKLEEEWLKKSQQLFSRKLWDIFDCRSMAEVEMALSEFVVEETPIKSAYT
jgi:hypothetical protein